MVLLAREICFWMTQLVKILVSLKEILKVMKSFQKKFEGKARLEPSFGLVVAGIDFAIGSIGGFFGDNTVLAVQDLNF
jgi:hypothetical protein